MDNLCTMDEPHVPVIDFATELIHFWTSEIQTTSKLQTTDKSVPSNNCNVYKIASESWDWNHRWQIIVKFGTQQH